MPPEGEEEEEEEEEGGEEEQHWASPSSTPHRMVLCDIDVKHKPPRAFLFRSHGFFHQVALTSTNTLSRLGQGDYELELRQCEGYRPSPRFLRFHVAASSPSSSPSTTTSSSPSIGSGEPLYVGTITMHELRFQFLRSLVPSLSTLVAMAIALVFGVRTLQRRQSTHQQNEREMKPSSSTSTSSRAGSPMALSSSALSSSFSSSSSGLPLKMNGEHSLEEESTALAGDNNNVLPLVQLPENEAGWKDLFERVYSSPTSDGEESLAGFGLSPPQPYQEQQQQGQGRHQQGDRGEEQQMLRRSPLTPCTPSPLRTTDRPLARPPRPGSAFSISSSSPASVFAVDSPRGGAGEMVGGEGGLEGGGGGEEEMGGEGLGWVNEYWSLGGSGSNRRSLMRDEGEESPTTLKKEEEGGEEEGGEDHVLQQKEQEQEEEEEEEEEEDDDDDDEEGTGERDGDFPSKQE